MDVTILEGDPMNLWGWGSTKGYSRLKQFLCNHQRGCWMTNTSFPNENLELELQGVGESLGSFSLVEAHPVAKSLLCLLNGD